MYFVGDIKLINYLNNNTSKKIFNEIMKLNGVVHRQIGQRKTQEVAFSNTSVFIKQHFGIGWQEIFKNLIKLKFPVIGAKTEYHAIHAFNKIGIPTLTALGYGQKGFNPATLQSFLITKRLHNTISIAELTKAWHDKPPSLTFKRLLIKKIAYLTGKMHGSGMNHCDLYLDHFLIDKSHAAQEIVLDKLFLIDLHRVQLRKAVPMHWLIKDLSGLYFSVLEVGLSRTDIFIFLRKYYDTLLGVKGNRFINHHIKQINLPITKIKDKALNLYIKLNQHQISSKKINLLLKQFKEDSDIKKIHKLKKKSVNSFMKNIMHTGDMVRWQKSLRKKVAISSQLDPACVDIQQFACNPEHYFNYLGKQNNFEVIKDEEKTTVVKTRLFNQDVIIKRYNVRTFWYFLRKCYHPMNAQVSLKNTFLLHWLNIPAPQPLLIVKEGFGFLTFKSYFIMQYLESQPFETTYLDQKLLEQALSYLKHLHQVDYIHGDFYPRNLLIKDNQVWFIDVDKTRRIIRKRKRVRLQQRDKINFMLAIEALSSKIFPGLK